LIDWASIIASQKLLCNYFFLCYDAVLINQLEFT
jgi:hypothetical protein